MQARTWPELYGHPADCPNADEALRNKWTTKTRRHLWNRARRKVIALKLLGFLRQNDSHLEHKFIADNTEDLKKGSQMEMEQEIGSNK